MTTTLPDIVAHIERDPMLERVHDVARARVSRDPGHDLAHALRVAAWTLRLLPPGADEREGIAAALLHDLVNVPKDSAERAGASARSADDARPVLEAAGFAPDAVSRICDAIRDHSFSAGRMPTTELGRALQDADRLEALGALGICRTLSTGVKMGASYFHAADPWARARTLDDRAHSVDHFFTKLLRLPALMHTPQGRAEAERRAAFLRAFLRQLGTELGCPWDEGEPPSTSE